MAIAVIAFTWLGFMSRLVATIRREGTADVPTFLELSLLVSADITFVGAGIDVSGQPTAPWLKFQGIRASIS